MCDTVLTRLLHIGEIDEELNILRCEHQKEDSEKSEQQDMAETFLSNDSHVP